MIDSCIFGCAVLYNGRCLRLHLALEYFPASIARREWRCFSLCRVSFRRNGKTSHANHGATGAFVDKELRLR